MLELNVGVAGLGGYGSGLDVDHLGGDGVGGGGGVATGNLVGLVAVGGGAHANLEGVGAGADEVSGVGALVQGGNGQHTFNGRSFKLRGKKIIWQQIK